MSDTRLHYDLLAQMRSGRKPGMPREFAHAHGGTHDMRAPLLFVPAGTLVTMRVVVPDNLGTKSYGLVWRCAKGLDNEDARRALRGELVDTFLNITMPIGETPG